MDKTRKHLAFGVANKAYISKRAAATQKLKRPLGQHCFINVTKRLRVWCANQRGSYYYKQRLSYQGCKQLNKTYTNLPIYYYNR